MIKFHLNLINLKKIIQKNLVLYMIVFKEACNFTQLFAKQT